MAQNTQFTLVAWIRQLSLGDPPGADARGPVLVIPVISPARPGNADS
jgi:hypothetical protein